MEMKILKEELLDKKNEDNELYKRLVGQLELEIYPNSVFDKNNLIFFIAKEASEKNLYLLFEKKHESNASRFEGTNIELAEKDSLILKRCNLTTHNRKELQVNFEFTNPQLIGLNNSFGFGDRIGLANPAHLRALGKSRFKPVLAQQSVRELTRTNRSPAEVIDAAVWAVFQEGYLNGFGADADHLKTTADIDLLVANGFKMFTFDPGEYVHNEADTLSEKELDEATKKINWKGLFSDFENLSKEYCNKMFSVSANLQISVSEDNFKRAVLKYGDSLAHLKKMYDHLKTQYPAYESEVEISVDETESVTSPFEHFFIAKELRRLGVDIVSLAPRFIGDFEKGIDYKGNLDLFRKEYLKHLQIVNYFGDYKVSLHSGSDKFSVYKVIAELGNGLIHIKTAGTSYLEALKVAAVQSPGLFREILDYCRNLYSVEKKSYHVSADVNKLKLAEQYSDQELIELFNDDDVRQVLHVTFGRILTDKDNKGKYIFKDRLIGCLVQNETTHYDLIIKHFRKHLNPFKHYE